MLEWEDLVKKAQALEAEILAEVMKMEKTQTVGNVRASYSKGRGSYDYQSAALQYVPAPRREEYVKVTYDWKLMCETEGVKKEQIPFTPGTPSASLKLQE